MFVRLLKALSRFPVERRDPMRATSPLQLDESQSRLPRGESDIRWSGFPALKVFTDEDGLPQNSIVDIEFDMNGYLWVATEDGSAKYNGRHWTSVPMPNRTIANQLRCLKATRDGAMWFG